MYFFLLLYTKCSEWAFMTSLCRSFMCCAIGPSHQEWFLGDPLPVKPNCLCFDGKLGKEVAGEWPYSLRAILWSTFIILLYHFYLEHTLIVLPPSCQLDSGDLEETLRADRHDGPTPSRYGSEQLRMRHLVVKGVLESEKTYLHVIEQLVKVWTGSSC